MAQRDASAVQLDFPELTADIIAALRLTGTLGLFNMSDTVIPVISVGNVRPQTFSFTPVIFESSEVVFGQAIDPLANVVLADTGSLAAGTYDIQGSLSYHGNSTAVGTAMVIEHRDAANAVTLATLLSLSSTTIKLAQSIVLPLMGYVIGLNERLRVKSPGDITTGGFSGVIFRSLRPTP